MTARKIWWFIIFYLGGVGLAQAQERFASPCPLATERLAERQVIEAYQQAQQCLLATQHTEGLNSETYADVLQLLSQIADAAGDHALALAWARREVTIRAQWAASSPDLYGQALQNQGVLYLRADSLLAARRSFTEAYRVLRASETPSPLRLQYLLAKVHHRTGNFSRADSLYRCVIREARRVDDPILRNRATYFRSLLPDSSSISSKDSVDQQLVARFRQTGDTLSLAYADACYRFANTLIANDDWQAASEWFRRARTVYEASASVDSLSYSGALHNLAVLQLSQNEVHEAVEELEQVHRIRQKHYTARDGAWWTSWDNLAAARYQTDSAYDARAWDKALEPNDSSTQQYPWQYAVALSNRATGYQRQQQYALAETYYARATRHLKNYPPTTSQEALHQAAIFGNVARNQQKLAHYDSAIFYFKRSTEIIRRAKGTQSDAYVAAVSGMAGLYHDLGYFVESDIFYQEALKIQEKLSGRFTNAYANLLNNYALVCQEQGHLTRATELLDQSLETKKTLLGVNHPDYGLALANAGLLHLEAARYAQARPLLEQSLAAAAQRGEAHPATISAQINLARLEMAQGNYPPAEQWLQKAITTAQTHVDPAHPEYARVRTELANFYLALGNCAAAKPLLVEGQQILKEKYGSSHPEYATATQNLAGLYEATGQTDSAEMLYQEALRIDRQTLGKQHPAYATALNNLAALYQNQGAYAQAKPLLEESLDISRTLYGEAHPRHVTTLLNLGLLHQSVGEYKQARSHIEQVVAIRRETLNDQHPDYAFSRYAQAVLYHTLGDSERAEPIFREVMQRYTRQLQEYFPALSEKEKSAFYRQIEPVLQAVQNFVIDRVVNQAQTSTETGQALLGDFYNLQLLTKAILLNASSQIKATISNSNDEALIDRYRQWVSTKETLVRLYALPPGEWKQQQGRVRSLEKRANTLEKELSLRSTKFANDLRDRRFTWQDIRQQLQPNEAAVEIVRVEKGKENLLFYVILAITSESEAPSVGLLRDGEAMEAKNYYYYQNAVDFRVSDILSYDLYWKPIRSLLLPQTATVYVAPDGVYHKISLNSLLNPRSEQFVIEETTIHMLSSTRELLHPPLVANHRTAYLLGDPRYRQATPADSLIESSLPSSTDSTLRADLDALSYPVEADNLYTLPGTEREVNQIAQLLRHHQWQPHTYLRSEATEEVVKQLDAPRLLHIATHAYFLSDLPHDESTAAFGLHLPNAAANPLLRSGLMLAGAANSLQQQTMQQRNDGPQEDGILTAYEAKNLDLSGTELVVLSACETGLGEIRNGEGVYGLQRAFLVAGAQGVLMSLWKVNDRSTAELMQMFYERWLGGENKADALRSAQLAFMKAHRDPYYWGAFVLIGR